MPTGTDDAPSNDLSNPNPDPGNNATFYGGSGDYTIDAPYWRTEVGDHENSESPYGTFDQGGNVWEWNEAILSPLLRGMRGASYASDGTNINAAYRSSSAPNPTSEYDHRIGFRVASLPLSTLTVNTGSGSGTYSAGAVVSIAADPPPYGHIFGCWIGDTSHVDDITASSTTVTMPDTPVEITATYWYVAMETVFVDDPGNTGEWSGESYGGSGPDRICGAVNYCCSIAKYEVTAGQYCEFLDAVAGTDTYELYSTQMAVACNIKRIGSPGSYKYCVGPNWASRPVNHVSWGDAARFANWLHNGKPTGAQDLSTTENGAYFLDGAMTDEELIAVERQSDATWVIPTEDEWYKAAYYDPTLNAGAGGYYDYPTGTDGAPSNDLSNPDPDPGNNATFYDVGYTIGTPYYRTEVGDHENSNSPYGTFDQGGNIWEWTEAIIYASSRGMRGGAFNSLDNALQASHRSHFYVPSHEGGEFGFRVSLVNVYTLTVNSGSGSGHYLEGMEVPIDADQPPSGMGFDKWIGDTSRITDVAAASTTLIIPAEDQEITATYVYVYTLTVNSGSGSGEYEAGQLVQIQADPPPSRMVFDCWVSVPEVPILPEPDTSLVMPSQDLQVTAMYAYHPGDLNGDGFCGQTDLDIVLDQWGNSGEAITDLRADPSNDGFVGQTDLDIVLDNWGEGTHP